MKDELINKLYDEKKDYIEENLDDFVDSLTGSQKRALERWMNIDDNHLKIKEVKNKIKLLLYNKRDIPLKSKDTKIKNEKKKLKYEFSNNSGDDDEEPSVVVKKKEE